MNEDMKAENDEIPPIVWTDSFLVGYPLLDRIHREFVDMLALTQRLGDDDVASGLRALADCAKRQFDQEDRWMSDSDFPPRDCHFQEHAAVMDSFALVSQRVVEGDLEEGRRLVAALADWFPKHMAHLDSALAHWLFKLRSPGKPIILRRGVTNQS